MNRRPEVYGNDAHLFRPERWETQKMNWEFAPFSRGPRACPAQNLAMFWAGYALVRLAQMIEKVENRDKTMEFVEDLRLTHGSFNGVKVGLKFTSG
jgi:cytochrome P450